MTRCPLCAGTGELCADSAETTVNELPDVHQPARPTDNRQADLRRLIKVLHKCVIDDDIQRAAERRNKKVTA